MGRLADRISTLNVSINGQCAGELLKISHYEFRYLDQDGEQPWAALSMPRSAGPTWRSGALFAAMDQHLAEGDLLMRLWSRLPHGAHPMHLLAVVGDNGIGRLGYALPGAVPLAPSRIERRSILSMPFSQAMFDDLVDAHLFTGAGVAGVQPKILLADRAGPAVPTVILKVAPIAYPGLVANEFLCLSAARRAGIATSGFDLSDDGQMLVVDRFDLAEAHDGRVDRLGFEDIAALMGLRVRDALGARKYHGTYQGIARLLRQQQLPDVDIQRFFEQVALSVMVRNGDGHLKNFGVVVPPAGPPRLSPVFDVVTTAAYTYTRFVGDAEQTDRTMALKLSSGRHSTKAYPTTEELLRFGTEVCGVERPRTVLTRIASAMEATLADATGDARIPSSLLAILRPLWEVGQRYDSAAKAP